MPKNRRLRGNIGTYSTSYYAGRRAGIRRNPGREDGMNWNGDGFLSSGDIDGEDHGVYDESIVDSQVEILREILDRVASQKSTERQELSISLLAIARPAKAKGVAKDFEVLSAPRRVIAIDDQDDSDEFSADDDDWESIYAEDSRPARMSYSAALRGKDDRR